MVSSLEKFRGDFPLSSLDGHNMMCAPKCRLFFIKDSVRKLIIPLRQSSPLVGVTTGVTTFTESRVYVNDPL